MIDRTEDSVLGGVGVGGLIGIMIVMVLGIITLTAYALQVDNTDDMKKLYFNNLDHTTSAGLMMKYAQPYQVDDAGSDTYYYRWRSGTGTVLLMKVSKTGNVWTYEKATDTWANRTTATYSAINE